MCLYDFFFFKNYGKKCIAVNLIEIYVTKFANLIICKCTIQWHFTFKLLCSHIRLFFCLYLCVLYLSVCLIGLGCLYVWMSNCILVWGSVCLSLEIFLRVFQCTCPCLSVYVSISVYLYLSLGACIPRGLFQCVSVSISMSVWFWVYVCFGHVHVSLCDCVLCMPKCLYTRLSILCLCLLVTVPLCWREEFCVCGFACINLPLPASPVSLRLPLSACLLASVSSSCLFLSVLACPCLLASVFVSLCCFCIYIRVSKLHPMS